MGLAPSKLHSIEREDGTVGYCKSNCKWATRVEQNNNKSNNTSINWNGRVQTIAMWAKEIGCSYDTLWSRINESKWSIEKALSKPIRKINKIIETFKVSSR